MKTPVIGLGPHANPGPSHLEIFNAITPTKPFFQTGLIVRGVGGRVFEGAPI